MDTKQLFLVLFLILNTNAQSVSPTCVDTPGWNNGQGWACVNYGPGRRNWCSNGRFTRGQEWTGGSKYKFPERNCCVCGRQTKTCTVNEDLPTNQSCDCSGQTCSNGKFCYDGRCHNEAKLPLCTENGFKSITEECSCSGAACSVGQFCYDGQCKQNPICDSDGFKSITEECSCSGAACSVGNFCYDGQCKPNPICDSDNAEELTEQCECSGTVCAVGNFCYQGNCATDCESSAEVLTGTCAYHNADEDEHHFCEAKKYFYDSTCQDSKPSACYENYFYPTTQDCLCGTETELCSSDEYCWDGACTGSEKCTPLEDDAFYGGKVYGKWFESERKMGMSITTPKQVKITEIEWLKAKNDGLKYVDTKTMTNITDWRIYGHCYDCNTGDHSNPNSEDYDSLVKKGWKFNGEKANWVFSVKGYNDEKHTSSMTYQFKNTGSLQITVQNKFSSGNQPITVPISERRILTLKNGIKIRTNTDKIVRTIQPGRTKSFSFNMKNGDMLTLESEEAFININSWVFTKSKEARIDCSEKKDENTCNDEKNWPKDYCKWNAAKNVCEKDVCKEAYVLDVDQTKYFGPSANYTVQGSQMKTNLKVKAIANLHRNINKHDYSYDRQIINVIPVLVNLEVRRVVTCRFKIDTPVRPEEGQQEFILQTYAEENLAEGGRKTVKIVMKIYSNTCVKHSATSDGVTLSEGQNYLSTTDKTPNTFTWDRNEGEVKQSWEDDMCVETLTWIFVPVGIQQDKYNMKLTFTSADMPSHKWSANVGIDIEDADVLADVGFGADMKTCKDKKCTATQDKFRLGDRFWANIKLKDLAVNATSIICETFVIKQTKDGKEIPTNMMESPYKFKETKASEDELNEHSCSAELDATHFHKSVEGYDTLLETDIKIEYVQGHTQTRRLLLNLAPQGMMKDQEYMDEEISVGSSDMDMTDEMYKNTPRKSPDTEGLSMSLTLLDMDASDALKTVEGIVDSNLNDYSAYIILAAALCFVLMTIRMYSKSSKSKAENDFRLLAEEDIE